MKSPGPASRLHADRADARGQRVDWQVLQLCRGAWARITIDHFRQLALQNCTGHRASTTITPLSETTMRPHLPGEVEDGLVDPREPVAAQPEGGARSVRRGARTGGVMR